MMALGVTQASPKPSDGPSDAQSKNACPDASIGETAQDCPWAGVARSLIRAPKADIGSLLEQLLPDLDAQLRSDAKRGAWKKLWGKSINFDELAQGVIVHPAILQTLSDKLRIPMGPLHLTHQAGGNAPGLRDPRPPGGEAGAPGDALREAARSMPTDESGHQLVHAGLEHTYGYLFSVLRTSFGYKRARWVEGEIARGFGLAEGLLSPRPSEGTLFANVTYFAGRIAFRDEPSKIALLKRSAAGLPKALRDFPFGRLKPVRLDESVSAKDGTGDVRTVSLRTDLVPFLASAAPGKSSHLLIYSIKDPSRGGSALITAFPVAASFVEMVLKPEDLGDGRPVKSRYNAYVEGVSGKTLTGARKVLK